MIIHRGRVKTGSPEKIIYNASIRQALNGYIVVVSEDEPMIDSTSIPNIEDQMEQVMIAMQNAAGMHPDSEIQRIIRENNKKPSKNELPKIKKVGVRIFSTFNEAAAFLSFIFEEEDLEEAPSKKKPKGTSLDDFSK